MTDIQRFLITFQYVNSGYVTTTVPVVTTSQQRTVEQSAVTVQLSQTAPPAANNPTQPYILQTAATQVYEIAHLVFMLLLLVVVVIYYYYIYSTLHM